MSWPLSSTLLKGAWGGLCREGVVGDGGGLERLGGNLMGTKRRVEKRGGRGL